ncbi:MAG: protein translocase subunit SecF [Alphaproteobacteria bacterium]|nr:protein translocase subunit SecF [Alphaproteobacteria bacterium]
MLLRLVPENTSLNFMALRKVALVFSVLLIIGSLALFAVNSLNYGIDFKGGISVEVQMEDKSDIPIERVKEAVAEMGYINPSVREYGEKWDAMIRLERQPGDDKAQAAVIEKLRNDLPVAIPGIIFLDGNFISPTVSGELKQDGALAVTIAVLAVLVYIWFRFEWQFGLGAVVALVHDVLLTVGFFAITRLEFNLSIIAAILTIVGYSLNDTVVVYDRVRENIRKFRKKEMGEIVNFSLNQTLSRTIMTSVTTLLALFALFFFGGEGIRGFTAAMIWGVVVGTYSSIFIASPMLLMFDIRRDAIIGEDKNDPTVDKSRPSNPFEQV